MLIAVEGMDGVGKTTIAKYISKELCFTFVEKPLQYFYNDGKEKDYADLMQVANRMYDINDTMIKTWFFSLGNLFVGRMFKNQDVVIDRHFVSNYYWNSDEENEPIFELLLNISGSPDITFLLYASPETRMKRLLTRSLIDPDLDDSDKLDDGYNKMVYFLQKFNQRYIVIDTENKTIEEVQEIVKSEIKKIKKENYQKKRT